MKKILTILFLGIVYTLKAQVYSLSPVYNQTMPLAGLVKFKTYSGVLSNSGGITTPTSQVQFQLSDIPLTWNAGVCRAVPTGASNFLTLTLLNQNVSFPTSGTYTFSSTNACKWFNCSIYNPSALPANANAQSGSITATFTATSVTLIGSITFQNNRGTVTFPPNFVLNFTSCPLVSAPIPPTVSYPSISITQPALPITLANIIDKKWKEVDITINGQRNTNYIYNFLQNCNPFSLNSNESGYYLFSTSTKADGNRINKLDKFDGFVIDRILFENETLNPRTISAGLYPKYIKNNKIHYYDNQNTTWKIFEPMQGDVARVLNDNGCGTDMKRKGTYIFNSGNWVFSSTQTTFNHCRDKLFISNSYMFNSSTAKVTTSSSTLIFPQSNLYFNNNRNLFPINTPVEITLLTQDYMQTYYEINGNTYKVTFQKI